MKRYQPLSNNSKFSELDADFRSAFSGAGQLKLFTPNLRFYRFSDEQSNISPWWVEASNIYDTLVKAKNSGESLYQYIRKNSALARFWGNGLMCLSIMRLKQPMYGFEGIIAPMNDATLALAKRSDTQNANKYGNGKYYTKPVYYHGGGGQVFIPGLSMQNCEMIVPYGTIQIHDGIDEIIDFLMTYKL